MKQTKTFYKKFLIIALLLAFGSFTIFALKNLGIWLIVEDQNPEHLDYIFTFASEQNRIQYSRDLLFADTSIHWVLSDYKNGFSRRLRKENYDMTKVTVVDTCSNTQAEINALIGILEKQCLDQNDNFQKSVGLISSPYHMRRIKMMVQGKALNLACKIYFLPVPLERYGWTKDDFHQWWIKPSVKKVVISEWKKILYYRLISIVPITKSFVK